MSSPAPSVTARSDEQTLRRAFGVVLLVYFAITVLRYAWVAEDSYITLRTVDNFVHGFGLRWNVAERVQSYTDPLWMLLLSVAYFFTREPFFTTIAVSVALSIGAFAMVQRLCVSTLSMALAAALLLLSPAFIDYSTSGLENPLSHLLLALFARELLRPVTERRTRWAFTWAALAMVTRLDLTTLMAPALLLVVWQDARPWRARLRDVALGLLPLIGWELFATVYYGFPFPNTAYAKLHQGIAHADLWEQGIYYYVSHLQYDPLTLLGILTFGVMAARSGDRAQQALAAGMLINLVYLTRIGGDFMLGRMLTPSLLLAAIIAGRSTLPLVPSLVLLAPLLLVGLTAPRAPVGLVVLFNELRDVRGLADERGFYAEQSSLLAACREERLPTHKYADDGRALRKEDREQVFVRFNIGYTGYFAGPRIHLIDPFGLSDPLLARLPVRPDKDWRIGHFERQVPDGYVESVRDGRNEIRDRDIAKLYDDLNIVTRGPIFSWQRFETALRLNFGGD